MAKSKRGNCSNREVVNVDTRLFSPRYDDEGKSDLPWYALRDAEAMCFWGICGYSSYNAWVNATNAYINGAAATQLTGHYTKILNRAKGLSGGAAFPIALKDRFDKVVTVIDGWNNAGFEANKTMGDQFSHPLGYWWEGEMRKIIDHFDAAACAFDDLDSIAIDLNQSSLVMGAPMREVEHVQGGYLGGHGGVSSTEKAGGSVVGTAVGLMALGAAGYFGFKVLTE